MFRFSITPTVKLLLIINVSIYLLFSIGLMSYPETEVVYDRYFSLHKLDVFGLRNSIRFGQREFFLTGSSRLVDGNTGAMEKIEKGKDYSYILNDNNTKISGAMSPAGLFNPVQLVTYFFNHDLSGLGHILFNMLALFFLGPGVERVLGEKRFMKFYLFSGVFGGALIAFLDPSIAPVVGASVAVSGVIFAYAYYYPEREILIYFLFPMKMKWLASGLFVFSVIMVWREVYGVGGGSNISHFGHLSGMVAAYLYFQLVKFFPSLD